MCNIKRDALRNQGKSDAWIFSRNHDVHFEVTSKAFVDSTGAGSNNPTWEYQDPKMYTVRCMKSAVSRLPSAAGDNGYQAQEVKVKKATMKLKEVATNGGVCRVETTTAISTTQAHATIKYRLKDNKGQRSKVYTVKTAANKIAVVKHNWNIKNGPGLEGGSIRLEGLSPNFQSNQAPFSMSCKDGGATGGFNSNSGDSKPKKRLKLSN